MHTHQRIADRKRLLAAIILSAAFFVVEVVGGLLTNSLALLADAGHMLSDVAALGLALFALWVAARPAGPAKTYGYFRVEILAALVNGLGLAGIALLLMWEAVQRLGSPPAVESGPMLAVAALGLAANVAAAWVLAGGQAGSLNVRGAFLHVLGDLAGSAGALAAGAVMLATGWYLADPLVSVGIGLLIIWSAWRLLRETVDVLLEAAPAHIDVRAVEGAMREVPGVERVHDLHVWTVTSGFVAMSAHVEVTHARHEHDVLVDLRRVLHDRFDIEHTTLQLECRELEETLHHD
ncbi:MAG TPA: cation diffusion facilitator family transporter [Dehalococcoidia bacterium]